MVSIRQCHELTKPLQTVRKLQTTDTTWVEWHVVCEAPTLFLAQASATDIHHLTCCSIPYLQVLKDVRERYVQYEGCSIR